MGQGQAAQLPGRRSRPGRGPLRGAGDRGVSRPDRAHDLHNELPPDPTCSTRGGSANTPHCFNGTNLHSHGLWVNPNGNSDNVLVSIDPGVTFQYEYNIPPDHPAGTFW